MKHSTPILCITGSDSTGGSGIQADIRTIKDLGGCALTAVTSVTMQNTEGIHAVHELPTQVVVGQIRDVYVDCRPKAVKVGMTDSSETIRMIRDEIVGCPNIVCSPGVLSSHGTRLMHDESIRALCNYLLPISRLLMLKCSEAEVLLGKPIHTDDDMVQSAQALMDMGAEYVMLRGNVHTEGRVVALLMGGGKHQFFSSYNVEGWQRHGIGGTLSTAIAVRLAKGDDVPTAVSNAHAYLHSQVVYTVESSELRLRPVELYNRFLSLVADNYRRAHDVSFYASQMAITTRYLTEITRTVVGKTPKQIIDGYLIRESEQLLTTTSLSIQEIALELGFSSQIVFARFFHNKRHCAPRELRIKS